jgi:hypothetical protein
MGEWKEGAASGVAVTQLSLSVVRVSALQSLFTMLSNTGGMPGLFSFKSAAVAVLQDSYITQPWTAARVLGVGTLRGHLVRPTPAPEWPWGVDGPGGQPTAPPPTRDGSRVRTRRGAGGCIGPAGVPCRIGRGQTWARCTWGTWCSGTHAPVSEGCHGARSGGRQMGTHEAAGPEGTQLTARPQRACRTCRRTCASATRTHPRTHQSGATPQS